MCPWCITITLCHHLNLCCPVHVCVAGVAGSVNGAYEVERKYPFDQVIHRLVKT